MNKKNYFATIFVLTFFSLLIIHPFKAMAEGISAPIILSTAQIEEAAGTQIQVSGLTSPNNDVIIYINGKYNGKANISQLNNDTAKFSYLSSLFISDQAFEVMAIAQDQNSHQFSTPTLATVFSVIEKSILKSAEIQEAIKPNTVLKISPPTLETPQQNVCVFSPYISGFSSNDSTVYIYIDDKLSAAIPIVNNSSSTSFFSYSPTASLERGEHFVYAMAQDKSGARSDKSNILSFCINYPLITATSTVSNINSTATENTNDFKPDSSADLVFQKTNDTSTGSGHKNILNILIFIAFITGLIIWMLLVNQELGNEQIAKITPQNEQINQPFSNKKPD